METTQPIATAGVVPQGERRVRRRYTIHKDALLVLPTPGGIDEEIQVSCVNLAAGGVCIRSGRLVLAGRRGVIVLPPGIRRHVEVLRCVPLSGLRAVGYELGLRFLT